jgi:hypothetical protein
VLPRPNASALNDSLGARHHLDPVPGHVRCSWN